MGCDVLCGSDASGRAHDYEHLCWHKAELPAERDDRLWVWELVVVVARHDRVELAIHLQILVHTQHESSLKPWRTDTGTDIIDKAALL